MTRAGGHRGRCCRGARRTSPRRAVPQLVVPSVREAMGPAAAAVHGDPSSRIPVIGVTGTNGKTTTVRLIGDLLEQLGGSATEIGTLTGVRTTPEAPELQRVLAEAHRQGHAAVAMEVSSTHLTCIGLAAPASPSGSSPTSASTISISTVTSRATRQRRVSSRRNSPISASFRPTRRRVSGSRNRRNPDHLRRHDRCEAASNGPTGSRFRWRGHEVSLRWPVLQRHQCRLAAEAVAALGYDDDDVAVALGRVRGVPAVSRPCTPAKRSPS